MLPATYINGADIKTLRRVLHQKATGTVLDVGCGTGGMKAWLPPGCTYTGLDAHQRPGVDVVADSHHLPLPDNSFDTVLCTSVLEHVLDERQVVKEIYRVLKPGGYVITTIPFMLHYHQDPEDYRRLTHIGLQELLKNSGFQNIQTIQNCGVFTVIEFDLFSVFVHARREKLLQHNWFLAPYYFFILLLFFFFKALNYLTYPIQKHDTSLYVGVLATGQK